MKFKKYLMTFTLFMVLMCCICAVSAVSDDAMDNITSEMDCGDDFISMSDDEDSVSVSDENTTLNVQESEDEIAKESPGDSEEILSQEVVGELAATAKTDLKIVNYTNFVKKGQKYYFFVVDSKGNAVANKKLTLNYNGKNYEKTTNSYGRIGFKVKLSAETSSVKITYGGDSKYNALSQTLKFYIDKSITLTIGNDKLLTNGYLRVYLNGPRNQISGKTLTITIGNKVFSKKTSAEGFVVIKPELNENNYNVVVKYGKYVTSKSIKCIKGDVKSPFKNSIPTVNGAPDIDVMPKKYVMAYKNGEYTLTKSQYQSAIKRDSKDLYLYGKLSKYTLFKTKDCPKVYHILVREKWNVIERALNTNLVKKNLYSYWPESITVSLEGKSYTYSEVRDIQNTGYTCGPTSASVCSQALRNYHSEKFFQVEAHVTDGVNVEVLKAAIDRNGFKSSYYYSSSINSAVKKLAKGGVALIAFLPNHYVSIIDVSPDGKKILVSNSYGTYNGGGSSRVPTDWVSLSYFKTKFAGVGLVVNLKYSIGDKAKSKLNCLHSSLGGNWNRQNVNERIPDVGT